MIINVYEKLKQVHFDEMLTFQTVSFNPDYALELRREAFKRNKFKCFLDFGIASFWLNQKTQQNV